MLVDANEVDLPGDLPYFSDHAFCASDDDSPLTNMAILKLLQDQQGYLSA